MKIIISIVIAITLLFTGCTAKALDQSSSSDTVQDKAIIDDTTIFTERDKDISYDEDSATKLILNDENVNITKEGVYILSGNISNGQVIVEVKDTEKVQLVLDGVDITSTSSAAIYIKSANKVFITIVNENSLSVTGEYANDAENNVDAVIFSKSDVTFNGNGSLAIQATYGHGIVGKDDLAFTSGKYTILSQNHGISANDSVRIAEGEFYITSGKDAIQAENNQDAQKGYIYILNGSFTLASQGDAISASGIAEIYDGDFNITTGSGAESTEIYNSVEEPSFNMQTQSTTNSDAVSQKGIKTDKMLTIKNGIFNIDSVDDSLHAAEGIAIEDGAFSIKSGDDAIHSDTTLLIKSGSFSIPYCYEGVEAVAITIDGGVFDINAADDGFNASGGVDGSGFGGGRDAFSVDSDAFITINAGEITIISNGDCIDSNGALTINAGTLRLTCNGSGNTAIDASGEYTNSGGDVTTNDGSQSGAHMVGKIRPNVEGQPTNKEKPTKPITP